MPPSHAAANEDLTLYMEMKHKKNILKDTRAKKHLVLVCPFLPTVISAHWHAGLDRCKVVFVPSLSFCSGSTRYKKHCECINQLLSNITTPPQSKQMSRKLVTACGRMSS